jgi:hypothetical protein
VTERTSDFGRIFTQYYTSLSTLREFFTDLHPVVASLDTTTLEKQFERIGEQMQSFLGRADEVDREELVRFLKIFAPDQSDGGSNRHIRVTFGGSPNGESDGGVPTDSEVIHLTRPLSTQIAGDIFKVVRRTRGSMHREILNRSILTTLVTTFEVLFADLVHLYFKLVPESTSTDDKVLSVNELRNYESIDEVLNAVVSRRVDDLLRQNLEEWGEFFLKRMKIDISALPPNMAQWSEMFQRRNLIVHAGGIVNRRYLDRVTWKDFAEHIEEPEVGTAVEVSDEYIERALDYFEIVGLLLCQEMWKKYKPDEQELRLGGSPVEEGILVVIYELLVSATWSTAEALSAWCESDVSGTHESRMLGRFNRWLCAKRQQRFADVEEEIVQCDTSATHPRFELARCALLGDEESFFALLHETRGAGLSPSEIREWPIFAEMRASSRFEDELELLDQAERVPALAKPQSGMKAKKRKSPARSVSPGKNRDASRRSSKRRGSTTGESRKKGLPPSDDPATAAASTARRMRTQSAAPTKSAKARQRP